MPAGNHRKPYTHRYTYDTQGRLDTVTYPSELKVESAYNGRNYLQSLSEVISPSNKVVLESYHQMNAYGQVTEERYRNRITTTRTFDPGSGRLKDIDTRTGTAVFQNNEYAWKTNGILQRRENKRDSSLMA